MGEFDSATNAGALGFGAACLVSLKTFDGNTMDAVDAAKKIVPKTMRAG